MYQPKTSLCGTCLYENVTFVVLMQLNKDFPRTSPRMRLKTNIDHSNIYISLVPKGSICIPMLYSDWNGKTSTLKSILMEIESIFMVLTQKNMSIIKATKCKL